MLAAVGGRRKGVFAAVGVAESLEWARRAWLADFFGILRLREAR